MAAVRSKTKNERYRFCERGCWSGSTARKRKNTAAQRVVRSVPVDAKKKFHLNFPQNRVTDHRVGLTLHNLDRVIDGDLEN